MRLSLIHLLILCIGLLESCSDPGVQPPIDRLAILTRHDIHNNVIDSLGSLSVGNGEFAFTVDVTGLQTFPEFYARGIPLGTMADWAWHSFPEARDASLDDAELPHPGFGRGRLQHAV